MSRTGHDCSRSKAWRARAGLIHLVVMVLASCTTALSRDELATEYYNIGTAYFELGELEKSAIYLGRALDLAPELARASYNLARVYVQQRRFDEALALTERLLEASPENVLVMQTAGYAAYEAGDLDAAATWYERALEIDPTDPDIHQNLAVVALQRGRIDEAIANLERGLEYAPDRPALHQRLAEAHAEAGDAEAARQAYARYFELEREPPVVALRRYAELLETDRFFAEAIEVYAQITESATASRAEQARAHFDRGRLLLVAAEEAEEGLEAISNAIALGFDGREAARRLIDAEGLPARADVQALLAEAGLLDGSDAPLDAAAGGREPTTEAPVESAPAPTEEAPAVDPARRDPDGE